MSSWQVFIEAFLLGALMGGAIVWLPYRRLDRDIEDLRRQSDERSAALKELRRQVLGEPKTKRKWPST